jgi:hypothetical protein
MLGAIGGRDGRGKTLLGMETAKCVLTGSKLFGRFAVQQGNVFLMLLDDTEQLVSERLDQLGILHHPNLLVATQRDVDMANKPGLIDYLQHTLPPQQPRFALIDALYLFFPSGSGDTVNSASAMGPVMERFNALAEAMSKSGTLALVAHDNKGGTDIQGSQSIRNMFKWIIRMILPPEFEDDPEGGVETQERVMQLNKLKRGRPTSYRL